MESQNPITKALQTVKQTLIWRIYLPIRTLLAELRLASRDVPKWMLQTIAQDFEDKPQCRIKQVEVIDDGWLRAKAGGLPALLHVVFSLSSRDIVQTREAAEASKRYGDADFFCRFVVTPRKTARMTPGMVFSRNGLAEMVRRRPELRDPEMEFALSREVEYVLVRAGRW
ncbi:MAG: hypothetical protein QMD96_06240 [Anaerosomatales bacterium]|nr:hypothetical protein [Anaerosomatales bacterium]